MLKQFLLILRFGLILRIIEKYIRTNYLLGDRQILKPQFNNDLIDLNYRIIDKLAYFSIA